MAAALSAQLQERMVKVNVVPDHVDWKYELGEKVKFNVVVTKNRVPQENVTVWYEVAHKLTPFLLEPHDDSGKGIMIIDEKTGDVKNIMEESIILESIVHPISISRIYAEKEIAPEVIAKIKEYQDS